MISLFLEMSVGSSQFSFFPFFFFFLSFFFLPPYKQIVLLCITMRVHASLLPYCVFSILYLYKYSLEYVVDILHLSSNNFDFIFLQCNILILLYLVQYLFDNIILVLLGCYIPCFLMLLMLCVEPLLLPLLLGSHLFLFSFSFLTSFLSYYHLFPFFFFLLSSHNT